jgi:hypothetical protein
MMLFQIIQNEFCFTGSIKTIDPSVFCKENPTLALQICQEDYLPEASRFSQLEELDWAMGTQDKAKHLATLYPRRYLRFYCGMCRC